MNDKVNINPDYISIYLIYFGKLPDKLVNIDNTICNLSKLSSLISEIETKL